jgi:valyl-tRNA synthetase
VLDRYIRLLHPLMPFVTETIWQRLPHATADPELLIVAPWPELAPPAETADTAPTSVAGMVELVTQMRAARAEAGIHPGERLRARLWLDQETARADLRELAAAIERLARIELEIIDDRDDLDGGAAGALAVVTQFGEARLLRSETDPARDRARLEKELRNVEGQLNAAEQRLADKDFASRAPDHVVEHARRRATELRQQAAVLRAQLGEG